MAFSNNAFGVNNDFSSNSLDLEVTNEKIEMIYSTNCARTCRLVDRMSPELRRIVEESAAKPHEVTNRIHNYPSRIYHLLKRKTASQRDQEPRETRITLMIKFAVF